MVYDDEEAGEDEPNQLDQSDHVHLGQILTRAGNSPATIVWTNTGFRPEHRAALDWLNEHSDPSTRFFGVEIDVVQIGIPSRHRTSSWSHSRTTGRSTSKPPPQATIKLPPEPETAQPF